MQSAWGEGGGVNPVPASRLTSVAGEGEPLHQGEWGETSSELDHLPTAPQLRLVLSHAAPGCTRPVLSAPEIPDPTLSQGA